MSACLTLFIYTLNTQAGVADPKFKIRTSGNWVNAFMQMVNKKGITVNSVDSDETPQNVAFRQGLCFLQHLQS